MAVAKILPPRDLVRRLLDYDPMTGVFTWRPRPREMFDTYRGFRIWNARFAGKSAGFLTGRYLLIGFKRIRYLAHRLAWLLMYGEPIPSEIDHIDGNGLNNQIANLRACTMSQNLANSRLRKDNSTGARGVTQRKQRHGQRYIAQIQFQGKQTYIGIFDTMKEAAQAYRDTAIRLFGPFARLE